MKQKEDLNLPDDSFKNQFYLAAQKLLQIGSRLEDRKKII